MMSCMCVTTARHDARRERIVCAWIDWHDCGIVLSSALSIATTLLACLLLLLLLLLLLAAPHAQPFHQLPASSRQKARISSTAAQARSPRDLSHSSNTVAVLAAYHSQSCSLLTVTSPLFVSTKYRYPSFCSPDHLATSPTIAQLV